MKPMESTALLIIIFGAVEVYEPFVTCGLSRQEEEMIKDTVYLHWLCKHWE